MNKQPAVPSEVLQLVERFDRRNRSAYEAPQYNETQVRRSSSSTRSSGSRLGHGQRQGYAEAYKDVVHEDALQDSAARPKAPDYGFRIGGTPKFFLEAKKPG